MKCTEIEPLIARYADEAAALSPDEASALSADEASASSDVQRQQLEAHVKTCEACRAALGDQRQVARVLQARAQVPVPPGFRGRVAARIDAERGGWLSLANWRAWTAALAPLAAALVFVAWLGGDATSGSSTSAAATEGSATATVTFDTWAVSTASSNPAAVFLEAASGGDALLEAVLTGASSSSGDPANDR